MFSLTIQDIISSYNKIKRLAKKSFNRGNYDAAMKHISTAANVAYNFNWRYSDDDFEEMLSQISERIITEKRSYVPMKGRMVFYDVFAIDNRGLTQQYIRALMSWDVELLFIFEGDDLSRSTKIINELKAYPKAEFVSINSSLSDVDKVVLLYNKIANYRPEKAFLHLHPSSVVAVTLWNALPQTTRYQVNLTDHAFWLGTKCIDYSLEFRDYGYTVSLQKRGLRPEQLLIQPYYPIIDCLPFIGFPEEVIKESIVIFTGGAFYKMYGEDDTFFKIIAELLIQHPQVIILLAGSGDVKPINNFIKKNNFQKRLILIGNRPDINHVFANCDIYLCTFPQTGGLMGQYAAINAKPILSYSTSNLNSNFAEGFINWGDTSEWVITHTTIDGVLLEAKKLIDNLEYRKKRGEEMKQHVITPEKFNFYLQNLVKTNICQRKFKIEDINYNYFTKRYLDLENNYLPTFKLLILSHFRLSSFILFPIVSIKLIFSRKILLRTLKLFLKKCSNGYISI